MKKKKVLGICGSTRSNSINHLILKTIKESYGDIIDIDLFLGISDLPHFNPDVGDSSRLPLSEEPFSSLMA